MSSFGAMAIGRTGVGFAHSWLDTIAHNLANASTVTNPADEPFRALRPVAQPLGGGPFGTNGSGVVVGGQVRDDGDPALTHDPANPLADENGYVAQPVVDMAGQMTDLMLAQRHYQSNLKTLEAAREAYQSALRIGGQ